MLKNTRARKVISLMISFMMVMGCFTSFVYAENTHLSEAKKDLYQESSMKIESEVMRDLDNEDLTEVLVYMKSQVDAEMVAYETESSLSSSMTAYQTKIQVRRNVVEVLKDNAELTQGNIARYLEKETENGNVEEFTPYHIVNMVYVKATKEVIENLSYMSEVEKIYKNKTHTLDEIKLDNEIEPSVEGLEWNVERVRANEVWDMGYDGTGVILGSLDSGVDWTHPALKNKWRGYNPATGNTDADGNWFDPVYNASLPADSDQHGTHVMGTMVGQEADGSNKIGVAPGAQWIAARVFNTAGSTTDAILLSAAQWMLAPGGNPDNAPDVVNNSWGGGAGIDDWYRDAVRAWRAAGILPVFSAGNQRQGEPLPWPGSISCPANYPESFAIAATDISDIRAYFSKLGPSPYDESLVKPNISGPGASIRSSIPGGGYEGGWSGTSMSAPAVSGTAALLLSANASLSVEDIEDIIQDTARPLTDSTYPASPNFGYGYGMADAFEAVSTVATGTGYISGRVLVPGEDISEANIIHEQKTFETEMGAEIEILAEISDDVSITEAELLVKQEGKSYWMVAPMDIISGDHRSGMYKGTITNDMVAGNSIAYKIKARDYAGDAVVTPEYIINIVPGENTQGFEDNAKTRNYETIEDIEVQNMPMIFAGIPVSDAVVTVLETGRSVKVDPVTGKFSMRTPIGEYNLVAEAYGCYSGEVAVEVAEDQTARANFILEPKPQGTITGRVIDRYYETPAAYATVRVAEDPRVEPASADADGYFTIDRVYEGSYTLKVTAEGFEPGEAEVTVTGNETTEVNIELKRFVGYEDDIIYDDGTGENALVLNAAPNGLAVRFTPEQFGKVKGTNIYFWDTSWPSPGGNRIGFAVYGTDADGKPYKVGEPIFQDVVRGEWNYIDLSDFGLSTNEDFYISTIQDQVGTQCPGVGIDENSQYADRSYMNVDGEFKLISSEDIQGGLMIRARMEYAMDVPAITNLAQESYTNQDVIRVEGTVTADGKVNVYVNDVKVNSVDSENGVFSAEANIPEERSTIKVTAELNGVETEPSASVVVIKDKLAPVLTVEKPLDNAKIKEESVHVLGSVTDDIGLTKLEINDAEVSVDESNNFDERLMLNQGENIITVKATDKAGNVTTVVRTVVVDLEAPIITNIQPTEDIELKAGDVLRVSFNAPTGGEGYFRLMLPFGLQNNEIGIPMEEEGGLYTGAWTVPEEAEAKSLLIEVVYISEYGYEITETAEGKVVIKGEGPVDPEPTNITNLQPNTDVELRSDETLEISFNAPEGGSGYYRLLLPFEPASNSPGNEMTEAEPGFYTAIYKAHEGVVASDLQIEVVFEGEDGTVLTEIAEGKITLVGGINDLPVSAIIIGDEAFDMDYLNNNADAQAKLLNWYNLNNLVYIKLDNNTIVTEDGKKVSIDVLPEVLHYFDTTGIKLYAQ